MKGEGDFSLLPPLPFSLINVHEYNGKKYALADTMCTGKSCQYDCRHGKPSGYRSFEPMLVTYSLFYLYMHAHAYTHISSLSPLLPPPISPHVQF